MRHLYPPSASQVVVGVELFFQLEGLVSGVRLSTTASESVCSWNRKLTRLNNCFFKLYRYVIV